MGLRAVLRGSVTWIVSGLTSDALPIAAMNGILLLINAWGVWQFLLSPKNKASWRSSRSWRPRPSARSRPKAHSRGQAHPSVATVDVTSA